MQRLASFDIVLRNFVPTPPGDVPAPPAFAALDPLACDLADARDPGTREFQCRLRARCASTGGAFTANSGASPSA